MIWKRNEFEKKEILFLLCSFAQVFKFPEVIFSFGVVIVASDAN